MLALTDIVSGQRLTVMPPTQANGKICYVELPTEDVEASAAFYAGVFDWRIRRRGDGHLAFDDAIGEVSGTWVTGRPPSAEPGLLLYIMVDSVAETIEKVIAHGRRDRAAHRRRRSRDHGAVSRPRRQRPGPLPGAGAAARMRPAAGR